MGYKSLQKCNCQELCKNKHFSHLGDDTKYKVHYTKQGRSKTAVSSKTHAGLLIYIYLRKQKLQ